MKKCDFHDKKFYGTATVGEKGQVVIPAEARKTLRIEKGEKLLALSVNDGIFALVKIDSLEQLVSHLTDQLSDIQKALKTQIQ